MAASFGVLIDFSKLFGSFLCLLVFDVFFMSFGAFQDLLGSVWVFWDLLGSFGVLWNLGGVFWGLLKSFRSW